MIGPGKYDKLCTLVRKRARARGAVVFVVNGEHGSGFSAQLPPSEYQLFAKALRDVADQIERDVQKGEIPT